MRDIGRVWRGVSDGDWCNPAAFTLAGSHPHRPGEGEGEGFADGAMGFVVPGPDGVGGVLDGGAAGVEDVEEFVAAEAGEFLVLGDVLLGALVVAEDVEEALDGGDFLRGLEAGEAVGLDAGDEGFRALDEDAATGVETGGDEVAAGGEVGGGIAVLGEHLVFLFGGALDLLEGDVEGDGGFAEGLGGVLGVGGALAGLAGAGAGLADGGGEVGEVGGGDVLVVELDEVGGGGGADGFRQGEVLDLGFVEVAAGAWGFGGGGHWRNGDVGHGGI
jgi:hypothetical protein